MRNVERMQVEKKDLKLRAIGISNYCFDKTNKKKHSIQFYDYDVNETTRMTQAELNTILKIFPYDLLLYKTKHGLHFISFALLKEQYTTKARAIEISKLLGKQDYWTPKKDLTLRVSAKWKVYRFSKMRKTISKKPEFSRLLKKPNKYRVSKKHLDFYYKNMGLPEKVYNLYQDCHLFDYEIKIYHYKTRD